MNLKAILGLAALISLLAVVCGMLVSLAGPKPEAMATVAFGFFVIWIAGLLTKLMGPP